MCLQDCWLAQHAACTVCCRCCSHAVSWVLMSHGLKSPPHLQVFLSHWGSDTAQETAGAAPCPNSLLYTSWVTATVHERAFYEGGSR